MAERSSHRLDSVDAWEPYPNSDDDAFSCSPDGAYAYPNLTEGAARARARRTHSSSRDAEKSPGGTQRRRNRGTSNSWDGTLIGSLLDTRAPGGSPLKKGRAKVGRGGGERHHAATTMNTGTTGRGDDAPQFVPAAHGLGHLLELGGSLHGSVGGGGGLLLPLLPVLGSPAKEEEKGNRRGMGKILDVDHVHEAVAVEVHQAVAVVLEREGTEHGAQADGSGGGELGGSGGGDLSGSGSVVPAHVSYRQLRQGTSRLGMCRVVAMDCAYALVYLILHALWLLVCGVRRRCASPGSRRR